MPKAWLGLGANMGDPPTQLDDAVARLQAHQNINITARSSILVNPAWGKTDQNPFHNLVLGVETELSPEALLDACLSIENAMGRTRGEKWGPRLIDIDVIAYERLEMHTERLTLPHPYAHERQFVIDPLREIAPEMAEWIIKLRNSPHTKNIRR